MNGATVTPSKPSSLEDQVEHQECAGNLSMDQNVTNPQTVQGDDDVVVEDSFQLEEEAVGPSLDVQDEVLSYDGEWMDSWRSEKTNNKSREKKKAKRRRNRRNNQLKLKGKGVKDVEPETICVIFVEHTANGELRKSQLVNSMIWPWGWK